LTSRFCSLAVMSTPRQLAHRVLDQGWAGAWRGCTFDLAWCIHS
jgi:hypothetical protein